MITPETRAELRRLLDLEGEDVSTVIADHATALLDAIDDMEAAGDRLREELIDAWSYAPEWAREKYGDDWQAAVDGWAKAKEIDE